MQCAGQHRGGRRFLVKMFCPMRDHFADFVLRDVTLLFGLYAVMVNNCSGVRSNETGSVRTFAMCMPLMMLMALLILCGRCVLFSESTDLSKLSEVVLIAESTAHDWTFNEDDEPDTIESM
jgi:hypothetical protein